MTAAGDAVLAVAYTQLGVTEYPPGSNQVVYNEGWGAGAWCATFVSWCCTQAGYPLPAINGPQGFSYCPSGQEWGYLYDGSNVDPQPGDVLIFSWEPWHLEGGIAICSSGAYAGAPAGDHTGFWAGPGVTVEGNTSQSSWDNGGAVMERSDRYAGQICCVWRPAVIAGGASPGPEPPKPTYHLTGAEMFLLLGPGGAYLVGAGYLKGLTAEEHDVMRSVEGMATYDASSNPRAVDVIRDAVLYGSTADRDAIDAMPKVRLISALGGLHLTDGISTAHVRTPDDVLHAKNLGWIDNDLDGGGNPIAQGVPDSLAESMIQEHG